MADNLILCIPGEWESFSQLQASIVESTKGEFVLAGDVLLHAATKHGVRLDFRGFDPRIPASLALGSRGTFPDGLSARVEGHRSVVYLIADNDGPGDLDDSFKFASMTLECGGLAVKIENSGRAHAPDDWKRLVEKDGAARYLDLFLACVAAADKGIVHTCGMQLLDLPESAIGRSGRPDEDWRMIYVLSAFQFVDQPVLNDGEGYREAPDAERYVLRRLESPYDPNSWLYNAKGMWKLEKAAHGP